MSKCLIAEYETNPAAKAALERLATDGFTLDNVSVVSSATDPAAQRLRELHELHEEQEDSRADPAMESRAASLGMLVGGTIAAPIAAGTLVGPFIIAGPLVGMAIGAAVGSLLGSMSRWGVSHDVSADYEQRVKSGSVLIIVHDVDAGRQAHANDLLKKTDPVSLEPFELGE